MKKFFTVTLFFIFSFGICKAQLVTIPDQYFAAFLVRKYPNCMSGGNQLNINCNGIVNETSLVLSFNSWDSHPNDSKITDITGIEYFKNLHDLVIGGGTLSALPALPPNLYQLQCNNNKLTSLPALPSSLAYLTCSNNLLTSLPALSASLVQLGCDYNFLTSLPALPSSLKEIYCPHNLLISLPSLPSSLTDLRCYDNKLTSLPSLPSSLSFLHCAKNQLTDLPPFPSALSFLYCSQNQLTDLPSLPNSLASLDCAFNLLSKLPAIPNSCKSIDCRYNLLTALPPLPDSLMGLYCSDNINLNCLPPVTTFMNNYWAFDFSNTGIKCLPNKILHPRIVSFPGLDTMPICSPIYDPNHCVFAKKCDVPTGTYVSNITRTRVRLNWDTIPGAARYRIHYRPLGTSAWSTIIIGSNIGHKPVTGLTRNTTYEWKINTVCSTSPFEQSKSSAIQTFSTHFRMEEESWDEEVVEFNVYPNPAENYLTIETDDLTVSRIEVKNMLGQTIIAQTVSGSVTRINLDVSALSQGMFLLHLHSANGDFIRKFVKE